MDDDPRRTPSGLSETRGHSIKGERSNPSELLERVWDQIDRDFDDHVDRIRAYLRQPSVSGTSEGIEATAEATAGLIELAGGVATVAETPGHPVVLGRVSGDGPRLLRYGMYDTQPADEPDWSWPPFGAEIADLPDVGRAIVARGSANSKGSLAAFFLGLTSFSKVATIPADLRLIVEGEEEIGSVHLQSVLEANADSLHADAAFDLELMADLSGTPDVFLGCKGILSLELSCTGGDWGGPIERALHSSEGVNIASPAWSLVRAVNALVDRDESPAIAGLQGFQVPPEDEAFVARLAAGFDPAPHLAEAGAVRYKSAGDPESIVRRLLYGAAININGLAAGYPAGGKTIIPNRATAIVDIRMPYGADFEGVATAAAAAVRAVAPEVRVEVTDVCPPSRADPSSPVAQAMISSHEDVGRPARVWPSAPWWAPYHLFEQVVGIPFAIGGAGHCGRAHATDEYASIAGLREHMRQSVAFLVRFAQQDGAARVG
jgi:acetylornithine deacetylase/succinyl-diaminopimelate desuccinylase-like protein